MIGGSIGVRCKASRTLRREACRKDESEINAADGGISAPRVLKALQPTQLRLTKRQQQLARRRIKHQLRPR